MWHTTREFAERQLNNVGASVVMNQLQILRWQFLRALCDPVFRHTGLLAGEEYCPREGAPPEGMQLSLFVHEHTRPSEWHALSWT